MRVGCQSIVYPSCQYVSTSIYSGGQCKTVNGVWYESISQRSSLLSDDSDAEVSCWGHPELFCQYEQLFLALLASISETYSEVHLTLLDVLQYMYICLICCNCESIGTKYRCLCTFSCVRALTLVQQMRLAVRRMPKSYFPPFAYQVLQLIVSLLPIK